MPIATGWNRDFPSNSPAFLIGNTTRTGMAIVESLAVARLPRQLVGDRRHGAAWLLTQSAAGVLAFLVACPFTAPFCALKPSAAITRVRLAGAAAGAPSLADANGRSNPLVCISVSDAEDPLKESDFKEFKDDVLPEVRDTATVAPGHETRRVCEASSGRVIRHVAAILRV